jgi:hypothetical protein
MPQEIGLRAPSTPNTVSPTLLLPMSAFHAESADAQGAFKMKSVQYVKRRAGQV